MITLVSDSMWSPCISDCQWLALKMLRNKTICLLFISLSFIWQRPVTAYKKSTYITHHTRLHRCSRSHNHLRYHITTGIGIGTRIGIGAGKKYRVSEVSVNPGIGLSLMWIESNRFKSRIGMHYYTATPPINLTAVCTSSYFSIRQISILTLSLSITISQKLTLTLTISLTRSRLVTGIWQTEIHRVEILRNKRTPLKIIFQAVTQILAVFM